MSVNLLESLTFIEKLSTGGLTFALGMGVVFLGMTILVLSLSLMGKIMTKLDEKKAQKVEEEKSVEITSIEDGETSDEIPEHIKVAIVAAIAAYYADSGVKNEFKVRKIKKI